MEIALSGGWVRGAFSLWDRSLREEGVVGTFLFLEVLMLEFLVKH